MSLLKHNVQIGREFRYRLTLAEHREAIHCNVKAKCFIYLFIYLLQWNPFINEVLARTLILKTANCEVSLC